MSDQAILRISLALDGGRTFGPDVFNVALRVTGPYMDAFAPVDLVSSPDLLFTGPEAVTDAQMNIVRQERKQFAKEIAEQITALLVEQMGARDTENGYKKK